MVDWGLGGGRELHVARMHAADRHQHPDTRLPPTSDMSREDEMEFNALDFVETEYKVDTYDASEQGKKQKGRQKSQGCQGKTGNKKKPKENAKGPGKGGRTTYKRRKRKRGNKQTDESISAGSVAQYYPYAALLKNLCDKVGNSQGNPEALPSRIFSQLRPSDVHYPYASLLQALHRHAGVNARRASSPSRGRASLEVARVMRNIHYPTSSGVGGEEDGGSPSMLCSTELMVLAMQEKVHRRESSLKCSIGGIGEILRKQMPQSKKDDPPPSELSSASLLQKLSLSAERDLGVTGNRHSLSGVQQGAVWSSTESSHSEEDDLDWRPTHWQARKVSRDTTAPVKRKSIRKKNFVSWDLEQEQPNTSQGIRGAGRGRQQQGTASESARAKLLQFILGRRQGAPAEKRSKKAIKRTKVTKKRGKRKHTSNTEKNTLDWTTKLPTGGLTKDCTMPSKGASGRRSAGETQSLLKEYLLKPAGEEVVPSENCDIPKLETNFLFSRLLQNFKSLVESSQPDQPSDGSAESCRGPSILRGMLSAGAIVDEPNERLSPGNHQSASLSSLGQQRKRKARSPPHVKEPPLTVKVEPEVVVECLEEEIVCKEECEEDGYECHVCHLQFSSLTDLSNHQVLFHCAEEPPTPTGSHRLLGCSVEGLAGGVMQGKQPA